MGKRPVVSDEQEQAQPIPEQQPGADPAVVSEPATERKSKKARRQISPEALKPRPSLWPFALSVALMVALVGFIISPVLLVIGIVLTIACIIGWGVERWGVES